jgi:hypothetical protein
LNKKLILLGFCAICEKTKAEKAEQKNLKQQKVISLKIKQTLLYTGAGCVVL